MKTFEIEILETLSRVIEVEAEDREQAIDRVMGEYNDEAHVLDSNDLSDVEFKDINEPEPEKPFDQRTLQEYKSETIGFFNSNVRGWWTYSDGEEGGELHINVRTGEVEDFDGALDLPEYIKEELRRLGIKINW